MQLVSPKDWSQRLAIYSGNHRTYPLITFSFWLVLPGRPDVETSLHARVLRRWFTIETARFPGRGHSRAGFYTTVVIIIHTK